MAVINAYVDADLVAGKIGSAPAVTGAKIRQLVQSFAVASTDAAGSIYRIAKGVSPDTLIRNIEMYNDALTGATSVKCGLYGVLDYDNVGAIVGSGNQFATAINIASGNPVSGSAQSLMGNLAIADREKRIYEIAGHTQVTKLPAYDIALTMTAMTTGANGNVCVYISMIHG